MEALTVHPPFRIYGGVLKYAGMSDLMDIVKSQTIATAAFVVVLVVVGVRGFPRSVIAIDWMLSIMLVGGLRFATSIKMQLRSLGVRGSSRRHDTGTTKTP